MDSSNYDIKLLLQGIELSKVNSECLFKAAELLAEKEIYGTATSLLILSAEENIKSFSLVLEMIYGKKSEVKKIIIESKFKKDDSYLFTHNEKYSLAKTLIEQLSRISPIVNIIKPFLPQKLKVFAIFFTIPSGQYDQTISLLNEFDNFNEIKNRGLYVDNKNGQWIAPASITELEYLEIKNKITLLIDIFSPKIDYVLKMPDDYITSFNNLHSALDHN